jgi:tetratricopeptide (TPR) repeat protein
MIECIYTHTARSSTDDGILAPMRGAQLCSILLMVATALPAAAEDKDAARKAYGEGARYYNLNQFSEALEAFKRAYWSYEEPSFLYNIAQCHRALKHRREAIDFYRSYLRNAPDSPRRPEVERIVAELEASLAKEKPSSPPPEPALGPPPATAPQPAPSLTATAPPAATARAQKPVWKRGWFWGVMGAAAAVVAGVAIGVGVAESPAKDPTPSLGRAAVN